MFTVFPMLGAMLDGSEEVVAGSVECWVLRGFCRQVGRGDQPDTIDGHICPGFVLRVLRLPHYRSGSGEFMLKVGSPLYSGSILCR